MNKFQTVLNRTFKHEKYGKYVVLTKNQVRNPLPLRSREGLVPLY